MPKDLTDTSQWETVAVPVDTDAADAASVETPFQLLADRTRYLRHLLASLQLLNWDLVDTAALSIGGGAGDCAADGHYDPVADINDVIDDGGVAAAFEESSSPGGLIYAAGTPPGAVATSVPSIADDGAGGRAISGNANGIYHSAARGAWAIPGPWATGTNHRFVRHDHSGLWVIAKDDGGGILYDIKKAASIAAAFAAPATPPGWTGGGSGILCIEHSHDAGNPLWVALTTAQRSTSADGNIWTAAAAHGMGSAPMALGYSADGEKWLSVLASKSLGASVDGATWSVTTPFAGSGLGSLTAAQIASDGDGNWVVVMSDGADVEVWVSWDNGLTWRIAHLPATPIDDHITLWYGGGRFHLFTNDGAGNIAAFVSLRAGE